MSTGVRKASSPRRDLYPSKSSPRFRLYRVTTAGTSLPFCATLAGGAVDFEALLRERGPNCVLAPLRAPVRSFLPWACVPFVVRHPPLPPGLSRATRRPEGHRAAGPRAGANPCAGTEDIPPCVRPKPPWGVCPEGPLSRPKTQRPPWGSRR